MRTRFSEPGAAVLALLLLAAPSCDRTGPSGDHEWEISSPAAEQMDAALLDTLVARLASGDFGEVHSLLVARHGRLLLERYFAGWDAADPHPLYSVTKSVTALLLGIARDGGSPLPLDGRLLDYFPELLPVANPGDWKSAITLDDVLTMRAGFLWDEGTVPYEQPGNSATQLAQSGNWIRFMLDLPMADAPGTRFRYNSGCSVLLGAVLAARTGEDVTRFAADRLFRPLGIDQWDWQTGPHEVTNTGWGLSLRPRDLARIGQMVLDGGVWRGRRLVSEQWVRDAAAEQVRLSGDVGYGYQWWLLPSRAQGGDVILAWGWGDQFLFVVPQLDLVVVTTAGNFAAATDDQALAFVPAYVFAAALDSEGPGRLPPPLARSPRPEPSRGERRRTRSSRPRRRPAAIRGHTCPIPRSAR